MIAAALAMPDAQLLAKRRAPVADEERIEELKAGREAALADGAHLATADPEEADWISAVYSARLRDPMGK
ncbi:hypothetical protein ACIGW7_18315 [Streptomyces sp. NPDC053253]|uniref:hypothetical protein n=1 Tax=Streptomyces sp. NPDC053253 TaxID=3365699 RepID=UPI0037D37911